MWNNLEKYNFILRKKVLQMTKGDNIFILPCGNNVYFHYYGVSLKQQNYNKETINYVLFIVFNISIN